MLDTPLGDYLLEQPVVIITNQNMLACVIRSILHYPDQPEYTQENNIRYWVSMNTVSKAYVSFHTDGFSLVSKVSDDVHLMENFVYPIGSHSLGEAICDFDARFTDALETISKA